MNKLTKLLKSIKFNNKRNYRRRRKKYTVVPQLSMKPQKLGIGFTLARVTREVTVYQNSNSTYDIMTNALESYEFSRQAESFNYFRLKCINLIQHPINISDQAGKAWVYMDWVNDENISQSTMGTWDNAKMLSYNTVKPITYTFMPPNARLRYSVAQDELTYSDLPINFTEWMPASEMVANNVPGWLKFMNVGNKDLSLTVDVVLEFKGAKGYDTALLKASKINKINPKKEMEREQIIEENEEEIKKKKIKEEKKKQLIEEFKEKMKNLD
jgi:hypothetical protein